MENAESLFPKGSSTIQTSTVSSTIFETTNATTMSSTRIQNLTSRVSDSTSERTNTFSTTTAPVATTALSNTKTFTTLKSTIRNQSTWRQNSSTAHKPRPPLVLSFPQQKSTQIDDSKEVQVKNAFRYKF